ncbi:sulfite exporter TauE/SafE family protein [Clostridium sp. CX1]|uniref:Probable membrane transporter protein n=1 Tax=Clostridium tanneri TaxID=3037988 RepID=A0ABU4JUG7_9CLOT|nr:MULTISPECIES: sulfite exporter TauE/SafE family protein [unclassified Clostridium]MCT8976994.1 sulfite exporter TauE/SafE family protein [Clostridium sp. CX1]MDW8801797.1 sulfite exporter TauE/SafE family protein [Clostridium sp. A1-XYC3]
MIIKIILGILSIFTMVFAFIFFQDYMKAKKEGRLEKGGNWLVYGTVGLVANFFDALGIGSFAPTTAVYKVLKLVDDRIIPGTLNVANCVPVVTQALIFVTVIKVDITTLVTMIIAATAGSYFGAGIVAKLPKKKVQIGMGTALVIVAFVMLAGLLNIMPVGGAATELTGVKLIIGLIGNFILGALMCIGIGNYAPCMALVFALGMSPKVAFPIMMGSCAFLEPVAAIKFVREGAYHRKVSLATNIFGIVGVLIAAYIVKELPLTMLKWVVVFVILSTSAMMFRSAMKSKI